MTASFSEWRAALPIAQQRAEIISQLSTSQVLCLEGETACGKSTQVPQYLLDDAVCKRRMAITQPRRVAAIGVAQRVCAERGCSLGAEVGYHVRYDDRTSASTKAVFMTDGMLLAEASHDALFSRYDVVVIDEAHERSMAADVLLGLLHMALQARPDLKVVVMSATLDTALFSAYFDRAPICSVPGRLFDVEVFHSSVDARCTLSGADNMVDKAIDAVLHIHESQGPGDVLVFLTGVADIQACITACEQLAGDPEPEVRLASSWLSYDERGSKWSLKPSAPPEARAATQDDQPAWLLPLPLHGTLQPAQQQLVFSASPAGVRRVVFATNVAEASVTVPGVRFVVDAGYAKINAYDATRGADVLRPCRIARVSALQRAGRAGREAPGLCFRLYTDRTAEQLAEATLPEIQRSNLASTCLTLLSAGVGSPLSFKFISPPPLSQLVAAMRQLLMLGAVSTQGQLTRMGKTAASLPVALPTAAFLSAAAGRGRVREGLSIAAMLGIDRVWASTRGTGRTDGSAEQARLQQLAQVAHPSGDHLTLLRVFELWSTARDREQWCRQHGISPKAMRAAARAREQLAALPEFAKAVQDAAAQDDRHARARSRSRSPSRDRDHQYRRHSRSPPRSASYRRAAALPAVPSRRRAGEISAGLEHDLLKSLADTYFWQSAQLAGGNTYKLAGEGSNAAAKAAKDALAAAGSAGTESVQGAGAAALHAADRAFMSTGVALAAIHPGSVCQFMPPPGWCVYHELLLASDMPVLRVMSGVKHRWLEGLHKRVFESFQQVLSLMGVRQAAGSNLGASAAPSEAAPVPAVRGSAPPAAVVPAAALAHARPSASAAPAGRAQVSQDALHAARARAAARRAAR